MTERHNLVVQKLCESIDLRKGKISVIHENKELIVDEYLQNGGTFKSKIRPDVWFWTQDENITKLWIVEVKCAFGRKMDEESGMETDSIKKLEADVWNHYKPLISNLKRNLPIHDNEGKKIKVGFELIIISSLGAIISISLVTFGNLLKLDNK
jgi:hypothetical protein